MRHLILACVLLMTVGCASLNAPTTQQFPQPEASLTIDCPLPPKPPKKGTPLREVEQKLAEAYVIWAKCAADKRTIVESWPKNNDKKK